MYRRLSHHGSVPSSAVVSEGSGGENMGGSVGSMRKRQRDDDRASAGGAATAVSAGRTPVACSAPSSVLGSLVRLSDDGVPVFVGGEAEASGPNPVITSVTTLGGGAIMGTTRQKESPQASTEVEKSSTKKTSVSKSTPWTAEEDFRLIQEVIAHGQQWTKLSRLHLPQRTAATIRFRWQVVQSVLLSADQTLANTSRGGQSTLDRLAGIKAALAQHHATAGSNSAASKSRIVKQTVMQRMTQLTSSVGAVHEARSVSGAAMGQSSSSSSLPSPAVSQERTRLSSGPAPSDTTSLAGDYSSTTSSSNSTRSGSFIGHTDSSGAATTLGFGAESESALSSLQFKPRASSSTASAAAHPRAGSLSSSSSVRAGGAAGRTHLAEDSLYARRRPPPMYVLQEDTPPSGASSDTFAAEDGDLGTQQVLTDDLVTAFISKLVEEEVERDASAIPAHSRATNADSKSKTSIATADTSSVSMESPLVISPDVGRAATAGSSPVSETAPSVSSVESLLSVMEEVEVAVHRQGADADAETANLTNNVTSEIAATAMVPSTADTHHRMMRSTAAAQSNLSTAVQSNVHTQLFLESSALNTQLSAVGIPPTTAEQRAQQDAQQTYSQTGAATAVMAAWLGTQGAGGGFSFSNPVWSSVFESPRCFWKASIPRLMAFFPLPYLYSLAPECFCPRRLLCSVSATSTAAAYTSPTSSNQARSTSAEIATEDEAMLSLASLMGELGI